MAASSLTNVFSDIAEMFQAANPKADVKLIFAGSGSLREQVIDGAHFDIIATANQDVMDALIEAAEVTDPQVFARNVLTLVSPIDQQPPISSADQLRESNLLVGVCIETVPCGALTFDYLTSAGLKPNIVTKEQNVRSLLTKVLENELDAAFVYATDAQLHPDELISIPLLQNHLMATSYPIAKSTDADSSELSLNFLEFLATDKVLSLLTSYGFLLP
jgi:molybdate transport system substrate-binding protein